MPVCAQETIRANGLQCRNSAKRSELRTNAAAPSLIPIEQIK
mgnify:CR=1 FL=1